VQARAEERLPKDSGVSPLSKPPRARLAREQSLSVPSSPVHHHTPKSPLFSSPTLTSLTPRDACSIGSRSLQAFAGGTTAWVDPNELQLDLSLSSSALRQRRVGRRSLSAKEEPGTGATTRAGNKSDALSEAADAVATKTTRRAARSQRLQELLVDLERKKDFGQRSKLQVGDRSVS